jgi:integrase
MPDTTRLTLTLADVIATLEADPSLAPTRRRDLCSAVRRVAGMLERDPGRLPASLLEIRRALADVTPVQAGVSKKTFQNIRSHLLAALHHVGANRHPAAARTPLSPPWRTLDERLSEKRFKSGLSRFFRFCSTMGIAPEQVSDRVVDQFMSYVREHTLARKPSDIHRRTCRLWNEAAKCVPGWPRVMLSVPDYREPRTSLPLSAYPAPFQADVTRYLDWLANPDPFDEEYARKPLRPQTITLRHRQIELAASAWVKRSNPPESVSRLVDLVQVETVKEILRHYLERNEPITPAFLNNLAQALFSIAKDWVRVDKAHLEGLRNVRRRLPVVPAGMTDKNRAMLRQFEDRETRRRLLLLPQLLLHEARRCGVNSERAAIKAQLAVAIELLLMAPIRMSNVIAIRAGHELVRPEGRTGTYRLVIDPAETKNAEPIEFALLAELSDMIDIYLQQFHSLLTRPDNPYLFPARERGHKAQQTLSQQLQHKLLERLGFKMTPHQFRHLSAWLYLRRHPGDFVTVQKLLGHKNIKTTLNFYAKLDTSTAAQHYDALIEREREALEAAPPLRSRRRRP